jgi:hypothetical protein
VHWRLSQLLRLCGAQGKQRVAVLVLQVEFLITLAFLAKDIFTCFILCWRLSCTSDGILISDSALLDIYVLFEVF